MSRDETFPGGRVGFHAHYRAVRRMRERIGPDAVYYNHTGPFFSADVMGLVDGYTAGEGEKGVLLRSRRDHAVLSASAVAPGALWTAAFPCYMTQRALCYMANAGQTPHVTLGTQMPTCSLRHPPEPGNVRYARPLWKLYGLLKGQREVDFHNDRCFPAAVATDGEDTGAAVFVTRDGAALVLLSNFLEERREGWAALDWVKLGVDTADKRARLLFPDAEGPHDGPFTLEPRMAVRLAPYDVCGILLYPPCEEWEARLEEYRRGYPAPDAAVKAYEKEVEHMRALRFTCARASTAWLRLHTPNFAYPYEDSMWRDLYDISHRLYAAADGEEKRFYGYIGARGFSRERPERGDYLWPDVTSPWVPLHEILPKGRSMVEIRSDHAGEDFYSFIDGWVGAEPQEEAARYLAFYNELDEDRARLTFAVELQ